MCGLSTKKPSLGLLLQKNQVRQTIHVPVHVSAVLKGGLQLPRVIFVADLRPAIYSSVIRPYALAIFAVSFIDILSALL